MGIPTKYFDAHCHIQFDLFDEDRDVLVESMRVASVGGIVVGVDFESSQRAITLVEKNPHLYAGVGLHPNATQDTEFDMAAFSELAHSPRVVTIGECGLDYFRPEDVAGATARQKEVFQKHIQLAVETKKPLMIHARPSKGTQDAYRDLIDILASAKREFGNDLQGNVHFFVGGVDEARNLLELDFSMSYTAVLTFTHEYDEVVRFIPHTHLLTETDSPYAAPPPNRGSRNDPRSIPAVIAHIAKIRGESEDFIQKQIARNAERIFKI
jgi:TatD DNase family protein